MSEVTPASPLEDLPQEEPPMASETPEGGLTPEGKIALLEADNAALQHEIDLLAAALERRGRRGRGSEGLMLTLNLAGEIARQAGIDNLTGLPNRRAFEEQAGTRNSVGQILIVDVDQFKAINDTYGHETGDQVLARLGEVLRKIGEVNGNGILFSRLGGDEFGAFIPEADYQRDPGEQVADEDRRYILDTSSLESVTTSLRSIIDAEVMPLGTSEDIQFSISAGAAHKAKWQPYSEVMGKADEHLHMLKELRQDELLESFPPGFQQTMYKGGEVLDSAVGQLASLNTDRISHGLLPVSKRSLPTLMLEYYNRQTQDHPSAE